MLRETEDFGFNEPRAKQKIQTIAITNRIIFGPHLLWCISIHRRKFPNSSTSNLHPYSKLLLIFIESIRSKNRKFRKFYCNNNFYLNIFFRILVDLHFNIFSRAIKRFAYLRFSSGEISSKLCYFYSILKIL